MAVHRTKSATTATAAFLMIPWGAFVAAFLFYVGLTLVAISVTQLPDLAMAAAYLLPIAAYAVILFVRALRALAAVPVQFRPLAVPRLQ